VSASWLQACGRHAKRYPTRAEAALALRKLAEAGRGTAGLRPWRCPVAGPDGERHYHLGRRR
jgi:hypothetical protein